MIFWYYCLIWELTVYAASCENQLLLVGHLLTVSKFFPFGKPRVLEMNICASLRNKGRTTKHTFPQTLTPSLTIICFLLTWFWRRFRKRLRAKLSLQGRAFVFEFWRVLG